MRAYLYPIHRSAATVPSAERISLQISSRMVLRSHDLRNRSFGGLVTARFATATLGLELPTPSLEQTDQASPKSSEHLTSRQLIDSDRFRTLKHGSGVSFGPCSTTSATVMRAKCSIAWTSRARDAIEVLSPAEIQLSIDNGR